MKKRTHHQIWCLGTVSTVQRRKRGESSFFELESLVKQRKDLTGQAGPVV